jgi:DNA-binding Lrp family transcriptional regulator
MITSIILLDVERNKINEAAGKIADIEGVSEVYSVTGSYDLVAIARVQTNDELSDLVTNHLVKIDGITKTNTMMAFRAYSKHDLEAMFAV